MGYQELLNGCTPGTSVLVLHPDIAPSGSENLAEALPHTPRDPNRIATPTRATVPLEMCRGAGSLDDAFLRREKSISVLLGPCGFLTLGSSTLTNKPGTLF